MSNPLADLTSWAVDVIEQFGYVGVALMVALENLIPPIPSEVVLPMAGFLVGQGRFDIVPLLIAATIGSMTGALVLYGVGYWLGDRRLRWLVRRYGKFLLMDEQDLDGTTSWFKRHGSTAVFVGRLVPGIRSLISIPAGVTHMPIGKFCIFTVAGSLIWNTILIGAGWILGREWHRVEEYTGVLEIIVIVAAVIIGATYLWRRRDRIRQFAR